MDWETTFTFESYCANNVYIQHLIWPRMFVTSDIIKAQFVEEQIAKLQMWLSEKDISDWGIKPSQDHRCVNTTRGTKNHVSPKNGRLPNITQYVRTGLMVLLEWLWQKFLSDKGRDRGVVQSTNGLRIFYRAPSSGKKPNQVKRKRAEKSHTPVKRLVLGTNQLQWTSCQ